MIKRLKFSELGNQNYGWLNAHYHFSFANYYHPNKMGYLPLVVWNDDEIKAGTSFPMHSHQNMEIITYIRRGSITHTDNLGNIGKIKAGQIQIMSAGTGITHSEYNYSDENTLLFQIWLVPNIKDIKPRWENIDLKSNLDNNINILASGEDKYKNSGILKIYQDATLKLIKEYTGNFLRYNLENNRHMYCVLSQGKIKINGKIMCDRDGFYILDESEIKIEFLDDSVIIILDMVLLNNN